MRRLGIAFLLIVVCAWSPAVRAESTAQKVRTYLDRAKAAFGLGRYVVAAENYEKAFELKPDGPVLYNAAQAHRLAGNKERALELYKSHLQMYADSKRAEIEMHVRNLQEAIARERAEREREKQAVVPPPAADVAPAETRATPPPASPKPEPAPTPPPAREPAREAVPEVVTAAPPARSEDVPQPPPVQVAATESPRHGKALPWGLVIGGGAVGIAGGAAMFLASRWAAHAQDTVDQTLYDASETAWKVGLGAAIAGGLSVATGLVWLALSPSDRPPSTTALAAWADGTGGGVFLARRW